MVSSKENFTQLRMIILKRESSHHIQLKEESNMNLKKEIINHMKIENMIVEEIKIDIESMISMILIETIDTQVIKLNIIRMIIIKEIIEDLDLEIDILIRKNLIVILVREMIKKFLEDIQN